MADDPREEGDISEDEEDRGFTDEEFASCLKVLSAFEGRREKMQAPEFKALRKAAHMFIDDLNTKFYHGESKESYQAKKRAKAEKNIRNRRLKELDKRRVDASIIRQQRIDALQALIEPSVPLLTGAPAGEGDPRDGVVEDETPEETAPTPEDANKLNDDGELFYPRRCYICKSPYQKLHHFYDKLCPPCAELNFVKRNQSADLQGRVALVTGCRVKIGYQCGLKLLRCGALVIATTRFPHDCARRYGREPDFAEWADRLHVFGLDLRDLGCVERFCNLLITRYPRLDIIVNNAAQTVRRPPAYYKHLMTKELLPREELPKEYSYVIRTDADIPTLRHTSEADATRPATGVSEESTPTDGAGKEPAAASPTAAPGTEEERMVGAVYDAMRANIPAFDGRRSAALSQVPVAEGDEVYDDSLFPINKLDVDEQQLDLRRNNTWLMRLHEISTPELLEVFAINALAPFIIDSRLKCLLEASPEADRYIINVSAMEGKFYRHKDANHPHTNMAKAALNMLTRTSGQDYAKSGIYMNAVDTGWITDENPFEKAQRVLATHFQTPIDEVDAMARILDPVMIGVKDGVRPFGKFYKDYVESEW